MTTTIAARVAPRRMPVAVSTLLALTAVLLPLNPAHAQQEGQTPPPPAQQTPPPTEPPAPEAPPRRRLVFGPEFGVYLPVDSRTRDAFGGAWTNIGVGLGSVRRANPRGALAFEFQVLRNSRSGSKATLIPLTVTYRRGLVSPQSEQQVRPYIGVGTGLYLADLRSDNYNVTSGFRGAVGVSVIAGVTVQERLLLEARYLGISRVKGFDLSGVNLVAGFRF